MASKVETNGREGRMCVRYRDWRPNSILCYCLLRGSVRELVRCAGHVPWFQLWWW